MENQLAIIIKESQLEETKAKYILDNFQNYFEIASEWELKAKAIKVTNEKQETEMEMARIGRLFLRQKRLDVENARKKLKEESLREGKVIDGIANVLKALIVPIEEYLEKQEKFIEIQEEKRNESKRIEEEKKEEEKRIAREKDQAEKNRLLMIQNENLKKEAAAKEKALKKEREAVLKKQQEAEEKAQIEREKIRKENEAKLTKERKEREAVEAELRAKKEAEEKAKQEEIRKIEEQKKASDNLKLLKLQEELAAIHFPEVKSIKAKQIIEQVKSLLNQANDLIQKGK